MLTAVARLGGEKNGIWPVDIWQDFFLNLVKAILEKKLSFYG